MRFAGKDPTQPVCPSTARGLLVAAVVIALTGALKGFADGEPHRPYLLAGSNSRPTMDSTPAIDSDGTLYFGVTYALTVRQGHVLALTPTADGSFNVKWDKTVNNDIHATPTLAANTVYIGGDDGWFYARDKATGEIKWSFDTNSLIPGLSHINGSPALSPDGQWVYIGIGSFFSNAGGVLAFHVSSPDPTADMWVRPLPDAVEASPVVGDDGTIYVGCLDSKLYAIAPDGTSNPRVVCTLDGPIWGAAAIGADGTVYVGSDANQFVAVTPGGVIKWSRGISMAGSPVVGPDGSIYVANFADAELYSLNPATGATNWSRPAKSAFGSTPVVRADNVVIFGSSDDEGGPASVTAFDGGSGNVLWTRPVAGTLAAAVSISPGNDHAIYIGSTNGFLYSFNGNGYPVSGYASWPTFQHDPAHTARAAARTDGGQLINLAARALVTPGTNLIPGYVVKGTGTKPILIRAVGPTLGQFNITDPLDDPALTVHVTPTFQQYNDNWDDDDDAAEVLATTPAVGAFPLPRGSKDAAKIVRIDAGSAIQATNTVTVEGVNGSSGVVLMEIYDADRDNPNNWLANISTRGFVGTGEDVLIPSVVVRGTMNVLVRAVGPGLSQFGVSNVLQNPKLTVYDSHQVEIGSNAGWKTGTFKDDVPTLGRLVGAFPLTDNDSALVLTLTDGAYSFLASGVGGTTGNALVEVYALRF